MELKNESQKRQRIPVEPYDLDIHEYWQAKSRPEIPEILTLTFYFEYQKVFQSQSSAKWISQPFCWTVTKR